MKPENTPKKIVTIKNSQFIKSFNLAKSNLNKAGLMILFDALFLVSVLALYKLFSYFEQSLALPQTLASAFIFIIFSVIYYLTVLFAYSFFKYSVLDFIKSLFEKTEFSFRRLGQFYALNIITAGIFFAMMILFNFILASIKQAYAPFIFIFLAIPYSLFFYIFINISQSLFYESSSIKGSIKNSFKMIFTKIKNYREIILAIIIFVLILWLLFLGSGYLLRLIVSKNYSSYLITYAYFSQVVIIIFDIVFYLVILLNRISFYALIRNIK